MDFRTVLSPTKRDDTKEMAKPEEEGSKIADIPRSKYKKDVDHTTVSTKRARNRGAAVPGPLTSQSEDPADDNESDGDEGSIHSAEEEEDIIESKPEFVEKMCDVTVSLRCSLRKIATVVLQHL